MTHSLIVHGTFEQMKELINECLDAHLQNLPSRIHQVSSTQRHGYFSRKECAAYLKVTTVTINDWCNKGKLHPVKIGRRVLFKITDVETLLAKSK